MGRLTDRLDMTLIVLKLQIKPGIHSLFVRVRIPARMFICFITVVYLKTRAHTHTHTHTHTHGAIHRKKKIRKKKEKKKPLTPDEVFFILSFDTFMPIRLHVCTSENICLSFINILLLSISTYNLFVGIFEIQFQYIDYRLDWHRRKQNNLI